MNKELINIFWFRRDLRLHDNHGLYKALISGRPVLAVFIFDPNILDKLADKKDKRVDFIHRNLLKLQHQLTALGSSLVVLHCPPIEAFSKLVDKYSIEGVFCNNDYEPAALQRDAAVANLLGAKGVEFSSFKDQVIFEKNDILKADGKPYTVFTPYSRLWLASFTPSHVEAYPSDKYFQNFVKMAPEETPSLREIGFEPTEAVFEAPALPQQLIAQYHLVRDFPAKNGSTRLSVHLRFGTLSVREAVAFAKTHNNTWLNELIWREFFMMILYQFPQVVQKSFKPQYDKIEWRNNEEEFDLWCQGRTGYELVDAGMRELNTTGFMHNRVRMLVASFLCKHLLIDWRWGEAYFAQKLLDYDLSANNGNWQWAAGCGCDAAPYFRIFSPAAQTAKFDANYVYIRRWIDNYYPGYLPKMVDHDWARKRALDTYKKALAE